MNNIELQQVLQELHQLTAKIEKLLGSPDQPMEVPKLRDPIKLAGMDIREFNPEWDNYTPAMFGAGRVAISIVAYLAAYASYAGTQEEYDVVKTSGIWGINRIAGQFPNDTYKSIREKYFQVYLAKPQEPLKESYGSKQELLNNIKPGYLYGVQLDEQVLNVGAGPYDTYFTQPDGSVSKSKAEVNNDNKVSEEKPVDNSTGNLGNSGIPLDN